AARGFIDCATPPAAPVLAEWLAGRALPDGLKVDADLRWLILRRLVVLGAAGPADIDAEAARDVTAQGDVHAAQCRAAVPDPAGKAATWSAMMTDRSLTNRRIEALGRGFWQPEQRALTAPYVSRFFAEIVPACADRSTEMTSLLATVAYPRFDVDPGTLEAAAALLDRAGLPAALHRAVATHRDELRVALAARDRAADPS
ncbi:MAG: ERAP1-like C-terminal domain-containing protein, partial [Actinocatenispora sp.]